MRLITESRLLSERLAASARGLTLIELIVATTILLILSGMAIPMARVTIKRERERQLRQARSFSSGSRTDDLG